MNLAEGTPQFYIHPQTTALSTFLPILQPHLPQSNPLYNRLQAPHNIPSRHCVFAATFPPGPSTPLPKNYTILFADRSRRSESQIWIFNPLITLPSPITLSSSDETLLTAHLKATILFLKGISIPEAPGWPFSPILRFACVHELMTRVLVKIAEERDACPYITKWNVWLISTSAVAALPKERRPLPAGFTVDRVPEEQLNVVLETSSIPRQPETMLALPNIGLLNEEGRLVAWGYIGIDGSFATLYVLPEYRGRGFATFVAGELLGRLNRGVFRDLGFEGESGWAHADVKEGNSGSEGVMRSLGGTVEWVGSYMRVDSGKF